MNGIRGILMIGVTTLSLGVAGHFFTHAKTPRLVMPPVIAPATKAAGSVKTLQTSVPPRARLSNPSEPSKTHDSVTIPKLERIQVAWVGLQQINASGGSIDEAQRAFDSRLGELKGACDKNLKPVEPVKTQWDTAITDSRNKYLITQVFACL